jgi:RND family efflux transporter MFP subunit
MNKNNILLVSILSLLVITGCNKKETGKSMEQIQKEEGIPVRVTELKPVEYLEAYNYNAVLSGIEESTVTSMVGDVITKINVKVGDYVKKDQVVMTFPLDTAGAQYQQANSAYQNTKTTYERMQRLRTQGAISQQDLDNVETAYKVALANYNTSQNMINVKAPISGYITNLFVNVGDQVNPGAELFTVSNTSRYKAVIWIPDTEIHKIRKGQKAIAKWNDEILNGYVSSVALAMDSNKKAFRAEIIFNTKTRYMASGVTAEISITTKTIPNAIVIDRSSLVEADGKYHVWTVENSKAVKKPVQIGSNNGIRYEIKEGLEPGDIIITDGVTLVYEGSLVKVIQ